MFIDSVSAPKVHNINTSWPVSWVRSWCSYGRRFLVGLILCVASGFVNSSLADSYDLDDVTKRLGTALTEAHIHEVTAADFVDAGGRVTLQGVFLSDRLLALLEAQKAFQRVDRSPLRQDVYSEKILTIDSFEKAERNAARGLGAEGLIVGTIDQNAGYLSVTITALSVSTGQRINQWTISVARTPFLDDLATHPIRPNGPIYVSGQNGVKTPTCLYCPPPRYTEAARKNHVHGHVILSAIIEPSGRAVKIGEIRGLSDGLTEEAINVVQQWKFRPGHDAKGSPVPVMVSIEVVFRDF
jgi:hypothetical protein